MENKVRVYEEQSKEMMTDNMEKVVIMQALPNEVKKQMQSKQQVDTYNQVQGTASGPRFG